jgi:hypothetical protein
MDSYLAYRNKGNKLKHEKRIKNSNRWAKGRVLRTRDERNICHDWKCVMVTLSSNEYFGRLKMLQFWTSFGKVENRNPPKSVFGGTGQCAWDYASYWEYPCNNKRLTAGKFAKSEEVKPRDPWVRLSPKKAANSSKNGGICTGT